MPIANTGGLLRSAVVVALLSAAACAAQGRSGGVRGTEVSDVLRGDITAYVDHVKNSGKPPIDYVVEKFATHDVVMLGEIHEVKEYLKFYADLVEPLYHKAGVRALAMECLKSKHNAKLRTLVTAEEYDREAVLDVFRDDLRGSWGFKEYVDLVEAVWRLNSTLPLDAERMVVMGFFSDMDILKPETTGPAAQLAHEKHGADVIGREVLEKGLKALVVVGFSHTLMLYREPEFAGGSHGSEAGRTAWHLYQEYGERIFQVCLHLPYRPAGGGGGARGARRGSGGLQSFIEQLFSRAGGSPVGFDVAGSPLGPLRDRGLAYFARQPDVTFSDVTQGYVILKPFEDLDKRMTWVEGFITDVNYPRARAFALERGWIKENEYRTPAELDARFKVLFESH